MKKGSSSVVLVKKDNKIGFIDANGNEILPVEYDDVSMIFDGLYRLKKNNKAALFNKDLIKISNWYDVIYYTLDDTAMVSNGTKYGYIDYKGREIIQPIYEKLGNFYFDRAMFKENGKYGFFDKTGKKTIPAIYQNARDFKKGIARVKKDGTWGFIDTKGEEFAFFSLGGQLNKTYTLKDLFK